VLDNSKVDLSIKLPLTERVVVKTLEGGSMSVDHPAEPVADLDPFTLRSLELYLTGELLATWGGI
jgi:hypothetical protein